MDTPKLSLLSLFLLFSTTLSLSTTAELCNPHDQRALLQIKQSLGNPYLLTSWNPTTYCCRHWHGVVCDSTEHRVAEVYIQYSDLSGQIPSAIGDLAYLQTLIFHKLPNLTGPVPQSITKLKRLQMLWITWTNTNGSVPKFLGQMKSLTYINLSFNNLTGSIPPSLAHLPNLGYLGLDRNKLTGSIPATFSSFRRSDFCLILSHNMLSGQIPRSLGNQNFTKLDLSRNRLIGDVAFLFGKDKMLEYIDLSRNILSFDFSKVEFASSLQFIDLNHNMIYGTLPEGLTELSNLQNLNVSYNRLCGQIPVGGKLQSFDQYNYVHNKCLCGTPLLACK